MGDLAQGKEPAASVFRILIVDDEEIVHKTLGGFLRRLGHEVDDAFDGTAALERIEAGEYEIALIDLKMPGIDGLELLQKTREISPETSAVIITGQAEVENAIQALRLGAVDFLRKPVALCDLEAVIEKGGRVHRLRHDTRRFRDTIRGIRTAEVLREANQTFVGESRATRQVRAEIREAVEACFDTILVTGETGVGKEVVAREIHSLAEPEDSPFIAVSCPALPDSLVESELFGHARGAFTGATVDRAGYFEMADGGTLFLDEVGDLSASAQAVLLRVLETRMLRRVGSSKEIQVRVRVIAATNAELDELVGKRAFRRDLFYRLNVVRIHLPPLRERTDDITPLARHFLHSFTAPKGIESKGLSPEAEQLLTNYDFPGNARELRNIVERATVVARFGRIEPRHLSLPLTPGALPVATRVPDEVQDGPAPDDPERTLILNALEETRWNRRQTAKNLGISYSALRYRMLKLGLS